MPTHLPDALYSPADARTHDPRLTLIASHGQSDIDWDILKRELNDRISMVVEYGYWKSSAEVFDDQLPFEQLKTVDKILAICRTEPILYVTGTIRPDGAGELAALTSRLFVRAELSPADVGDTSVAFTSRVWAESRREISSIELAEVSEARHDVNWPTRIRLAVTLGQSEVTLPLAKSHQVTKEENLALLLPVLLEDLDRR
jgi:hypothetical protein